MTQQNEAQAVPLRFATRKIISVLDVLVARLPQNELTPQELIALTECRQLSEQVRGAVAAVKGASAEEYYPD